MINSLSITDDFINDDTIRVNSRSKTDDFIEMINLFSKTNDFIKNDKFI